MSKRIGIYPGFFDPATFGHINVIERAQNIFDSLIVAVAGASPKNSLFNLEERVSMLKTCCKNYEHVEVESFDGLLVDYVREKNCNVILRGIRTVSDFEYEFHMSLANKELESKIETVFMMTDSRYTHLSSTMIKEIAKLNGDISKMVPPLVLESIKRKYEHQ